MTLTARTSALALAYLIELLELEIDLATDDGVCVDCEDAEAGACGECGAPDEQWEYTTPVGVWEA
ncbi:hypothetical protein KGD82_16495 [Nocardiopsis eucommiae]|uniref:Uncharacterized protein n=1 Tax=Nocardiopsis eucommiae TaxID=2831970 RepID=A0A975L6L6_9ACTN|nr:hypothetical protein KGD82_16495 [Nocardiopsis eucommiae]